MIDWFIDNLVMRWSVTRELYWRHQLAKIYARAERVRRGKLARLECQHRDLMEGG